MIHERRYCKIFRRTEHLLDCVEVESYSCRCSPDLTPAIARARCVLTCLGLELWAAPVWSRTGVSGLPSFHLVEWELQILTTSTPPSLPIRISNPFLIQEAQLVWGPSYGPCHPLQVWPSHKDYPKKASKEISVDIAHSHLQSREYHSYKQAIFGAENLAVCE